MGLRLKKEGRALLAPFAVAAAACLAVLIFPQFSREARTLAMLPLMALGCAAIAATTFGHELAAGTLDRLLTQPIERARIWREKMAVLGAALAPFFLGALVAALWNYRNSEYSLGYGDRNSEYSLAYGVYALIPICAFCTAPALTLISRSPAGAVLFTLAIPCALDRVAVFFSGLSDPAASSFDPGRQRAYYFLWIFGVYCVGALALGYQRWLHFEMAKGARRKFAWRSAEPQLIISKPSRSPERRNVYLSIVLKELRLQQLSFLLFGVFLLVQVLTLIPAVAAPLLETYGVGNGQAADYSDYFMAILFLYVVVLPMVVGGIAIAEENNLGSREWHLALPLSVTRQWLAKLGVVLVLSLFLGVVCPFILSQIVRQWVTKIPAGWPPLPFLASYLSAQLLATAIALYASSVSINSLRGITVAFGTITGAVALVVLIFFQAGTWNDESNVWHALQVFYDLSPAGYAALLIGSMLAAFLAFFGLVLACSLANFREPRITGSRVSLQVMLLIATGGLTTVLVQSVWFTLGWPRP